MKAFHETLINFEELIKEGGQSVSDINAWNKKPRAELNDSAASKEVLAWSVTYKLLAPILENKTISTEDESAQASLVNMIFSNEGVLGIEIGFKKNLAIMFYANIKKAAIDSTTNDAWSKAVKFLINTGPTFLSIVQNPDTPVEVKNYIAVIFYSIGNIYQSLIMSEMKKVKKYEMAKHMYSSADGMKLARLITDIFAAANLTNQDVPKARKAMATFIDENRKRISQKVEFDEIVSNKDALLNMGHSTMEILFPNLYNAEDYSDIDEARDARNANYKKVIENAKRSFEQA